MVRRYVMGKLLPQTFNDTLCLCLMGVISLLWALDGFNWRGFELNKEVLGASIAFFTIIGQYYYRKAKSENKP
jgi:hypothetical protein